MDDVRVAPQQIAEEEWLAKAGCVGCDPELFWPERGASVKQAKAVCDACVLVESCREIAIETPIPGDSWVWGGLTQRELRRVRRERRVARSIHAELPDGSLLVQE